MLLTYALLNCRMDPYIWDAPSQFPIIDAWAQRLTGKGYRLQSVGNPNVAGDPDVYTYDYRGTVMRVKVIRFAMFAGSRNVQGCLWVPSSISVLDTTIDPSGKSATVTFRYGPKTATPFAADMFALSPTPSADERVDEMSAGWTVEHTAFFQKLDATGWRVDSIR